MSGNFAMLDMDDHIIGNLKKVFATVTDRPGVAHAGPAPHPDIPWTPQNQEAIVQAFTGNTAIAGNATPHHRYIEIGSESQLSTPDIDKRVKLLMDLGITRFIRYPNIGLKALNNRPVAEYGSKSPLQMYQAGHVGHALVLSVVLNTISIQYHRRDGEWV